MAKKTFTLEHFCEPLMDDASYFSKRMFGGLAIYFNDLMVLVLVENPGERSYRDQNFNFDIWNGVMLATSRENHSSLQQQYPQLKQHPVLGKWLYLPMHSADFENDYESIVEQILKQDPRIGIVPGARSKKSKKKSKKK